MIKNRAQGTPSLLQRSPPCSSRGWIKKLGTSTVVVFEHDDGLSFQFEGSPWGNVHLEYAAMRALRQLVERRSHARESGEEPSIS